MERRARRRRLIAAALCLSACGGASGAKPAASPAPVAPDAAVAVVAPADAAPPDHCGGYAIAVAPVLGRIARNAELFLDRLNAAHQASEVVNAANTLAASLDGERPAFDAIRTTVPELDAAHARLSLALSGLAGAVRDLGAAYVDQSQVAARESSSRALSAALRGWADAVRGIQLVCPDLQ